MWLIEASTELKSGTESRRMVPLFRENKGNQGPNRGMRRGRNSESTRLLLHEFCGKKSEGLHVQRIEESKQRTHEKGGCLDKGSQFLLQLITQA